MESEAHAPAGIILMSTRTPQPSSEIQKRTNLMGGLEKSRLRL